jgi:hypothetical protein
MVMSNIHSQQPAEGLCLEGAAAEPDSTGLVAVKTVISDKTGIFVHGTAAAAASGTGC